MKTKIKWGLIGGLIGLIISSILHFILFFVLKYDNTWGFGAFIFMIIFYIPSIILANILAFILPLPRAKGDSGMYLQTGLFNIPSYTIIGFLIGYIIGLKKSKKEINNEN